MSTVGRGDPMDKKKPSFFARFLLVLLVTALLLGIAGYGALYILLNGPSDYAGDMFAAAVEDVPFGDTVLRLFLSDAEIERAQTLNDQGNAGEQLFSVYP